MTLYEPLLPNHTRVLTLFPSPKSTDPIECSLEPVHLLAAPFSSFSFDALSYVWGQGSEHNTIRINGITTRVSANLDNALRNLRKKAKRKDATSARRLWVDAVCIDQSNVRERNAQVRMMGRIYRDAKAVRVWLGEGSRETDRAITWMKKRLRCGDVLDAAELQRERERTDRAVREEEVGMRQLVELKYWHRMWTCQEFALSTLDPVIMCGNSWFDAGYLWPALQAKGLLQDMNMLWTENGRMNNAYTARFPSMQTSILIRHAMMRRGQVPYRISPKLGLFLCLTWARGCEDPKDKIFALHGLIDRSELPPPEYDETKTYETVVAEAVAFVVNVEKDLDIFSCLAVRSVSDERVAPSWLPDLFDGDPGSSKCPAHFMTKEACSRGGLHCPDAGRNPCAVVTGDLKTLKLNGIYIDRIRDVVHFGGTVVAIKNQIPMLLDLIRRRREELAKLNAMIPDDFNVEPSIASMILERRRQDFWKTLAPRIDDEGDDENRPSLEGRFQKLLLSISTRDPTAHLAALYDSLQHMFGRTFFITESVLFGVGVSGVNEGDELTLCRGIKLPLVLRRHRHGRGSESDTYSMIGGAYVSGAMNGEVGHLDSIASRMKEFRIS